jgi:3-oxoacyl-[acyl-carrier protein] reductase
MDDEILRAFDLSGRVAVITGAGGGIGRQAALTFAGAGAAVVIADVLGDRLDETAAALERMGAKVTVVPTDMSRKAEVDALADAALANHGRLDVWGNVAAILRHNQILDVGEEELDALIAVNLKGVFFGCQAAGRAMVAAGRGSIVNIASQGMDHPAPMVGVYALTKAAVAMLTRTLAAELGPHGVRVNTVAPGFIPTPMTAYRWSNADGTVDADRQREAFDTMAGMVPLRRVGEPLDIALAMLYLASDGTKFMTGQVIRPNGGGSMAY